jgi:hypothetical protein
MTTTTPNKGAIVYASAAAGDAIAAGVTDTYDIDFSAALYGGQVTVRIQPQATLTTATLGQVLQSDEQGSPAFFDLGIDFQSGLVNGQNYDFSFAVSPQLRKLRVSIKNQDATSGIKAWVFSNVYTSVTTA